MNFIYAPVLLLLLLLIPAAIFLVGRYRARLAALQRLGDQVLIQNLAQTVIQQRRLWKSFLWLLTVGTLIIALARPVWGIDLDIIETQGVSVIVVLDVSNSMVAQDLVPNRLERAKLTIRDLLSDLMGNEIGMIVFAGAAYVQFPLTTDTISAETFVSTVNTETISQQGTAIEDALRLAMNTFSPQSPAAKIIVLMTDGENHEGDALEAASEAAERGIIIHTIGYGDPQGSAIPLIDSNGFPAGYKTDNAGDIVLSWLDEVTLQTIAGVTGGIYQRAGVGESTVIANAIQEAQTGDLGTRTEERGVERFGIFIALALLTLSTEMMLPETRRMTA